MTFYSFSSYESVSEHNRLTRVSPGAGYLDDVSMVTARQGPGVPARWVEHCTCPQGYQGQHCEQCTLGNRRTRPELGAFSPCEPCNCNGHSDACDPETGDGVYCLLTDCLPPVYSLTPIYCLATDCLLFGCPYRSM